MPPLPIRSWHAHIYYDGPAQRELAADLRAEIAAHFAVQLGRWRDSEVGPHTRAMYMVAFEPPLFDRFVPWLALNRRGLDVLLHPNTLAPRADHLVHALWLGRPLPLKPEVLPESVAVDDEPVQINTQPEPAAGGVAWIAGVGASAGLGAALARRYAAGGLAVALTARSADRLATVAAELQARGARVHRLQGDIADPADAERLGAALAPLGPLRAAVFNAGNAVRGGALDLAVDDFDAALRGGAHAAFAFAQQAVRALLANGVDPSAPQGRGSLIFTGATASLRGGAKFAAFAASKAALRSLAQSLARDFGPQGIHVGHVVIDGGIDGEQLRSRAPQRAEQAGPDGLLSPDAIAETYWQLHCQHRSAWTLELDLRPYKEPF